MTTLIIAIALLCGPLNVAGTTAVQTCQTNLVKCMEGAKWDEKKLPWCLGMNATSDANAIPSVLGGQ